MRERWAWSVAAVLGVALASLGGLMARDAPTAGDVVELLRRVRAVGLPASVPPSVARRADPLWVAEYQSSNLAEGFYTPELLEDRDKDLYRDLKRFWRTRERERLLLVPDLATRYSEEQDSAIREAMPRLLHDFATDAWEFPEQERVAVAPLLKALDAPGSPRGKEMLFLALRSVTKELTPEQCALVDLAHESTSWGESALVDLVRFIAKQGRTCLESSKDALLGISEEDPSLWVRAEAVISLRTLMSDQEWIQMGIGLLGTALSDPSPAAINLIRVFGMEQRRCEVVPLLRRALENDDPERVAFAIRALERIFPDSPAKDLYDRLAIVGASTKDSDSFRNEVVSAQSKARSEWERWFAMTGGVAGRCSDQPAGDAEVHDDPAPPG